MPMSINDRHIVPAEHAHLPFAELSYYLISKLEETKYPTAIQLSQWMEEHADHCLNMKSVFGYRPHVPNKVKRLS